MHAPDPIHDLFNRHRLRCTRQRRALYEALMATCGHPTADQLYREVAPHVEGMSLATVYNTLDALCDAGLARRLPGVGLNGSTRYDATVSDHLHARDERTGRLRDVPEELSRQLLDAIPRDTLQRIERELGFQLHHLNVELIGQFAPGADAGLD